MGSGAAAGAEGDLTVPRRLHPLSPVLVVIAQSGRIVLPVVALMGSMRLVGLGLAVLLLAGFFGYQVLVWRRFTYAVVDGTLRIEHGVLQRHVREIPVTRIQQVDVRRQLLHRIVGVVALRVDTAGGGSNVEVTLDCLGEESARVLRAALLDPRHRVSTEGPTAAILTDHEAPQVRPWDANAPQGAVWAAADPTLDYASTVHDHRNLPGQVPPAAPSVEQLLRLSTRDLVTAGLTGSGLLAGLSVVGFVAVTTGEMGFSATEAGGWLTAALGTVVAVVGAVLLTLPFMLIAAAVGSILRDHDLTLVRYGNDLHVKRGLLDQREATIALHRIQSVWVADNPLRRRLGLVSLQLQSAGGASGPGQADTTTIPLVRRRDLAWLLAALLPETDADPPIDNHNPPGSGADQSQQSVDPATGLRVRLVGAPRPALRRSVARFLIPSACLVVMGGVLAGSLVAAVGLSVVLMIGSGLAGRARYRTLGHAITPTTVVTRTGLVIHRTAVVPVARTQSCEVRASPFQRRLGLVSVFVHVASRSGAARLIDVEDQRGREVVDHALGSPTTRRDEVATRRALRRRRLLMADQASSG